jgi:dephospho-CoA kinase
MGGHGGGGATFGPVKLVALTGGIGAGKSSVSERLAARGAHIIDADAVVKELQRPGRPVFAEIVQRWGGRIVAADGSLDRAAVAELVFADRAELEALNAIVHPAVRAEMRAQADAAAAGDGVVVLDIPLLVEDGADQRGASAVIVVDCPTSIAIDRLIELRGFDRGDAEARVAAQISRERRLALADFVVDNGGDIAQLEAEVDRCWAWLDGLDQTPWPPPGPGADQAGRPQERAADRR